MDDEQWQKGRLIGDGTFGSVYIGLNQKTRALCAIKEINFLHHNPVQIVQQIPQLAQETRDLGRLSHPNIVKYYGCEIFNDTLLRVYMQYVNHGSISKYMIDHGSITEPVLRVFTRHVVLGLDYLHSVNVMHRDVKGANLLIDGNGIVKIADFGIAKRLDGFVGGDALSSVKRSLRWMAPELMEDVLQGNSGSGLRELTLAVDIWSLGCAVVEMFTGKPPWSEYEDIAAIFKIGKTESTPSIPGELSDDGKDFLRCCFRRNPAERSSAALLLEHPFLSNL